MPYAHYVLAGLLLLLAYYLMKSCYFKLPVERRLHDHLLNPGFEETGLETLHFAFKASVGTHFESSIASRFLQNDGKLKELVGTWEGTFEGRNATLDITTANSEGLKATIHVQYTNLTNEALTGTVNTVTNTIHFDDVYKNGTLDGQYNGTFTGDGMDAFEGTYENYTTKKQVNFSFKKAKADVEN